MDIKGCIDSLQADRHSPATIAAYRRELQHFNAFLLQQRLRVSQVKPKVILAYMKHRDPEDQLRPASIRRRLAVLSGFFDYMSLTSNGRIKNPVTVIRRPKRQRPTPTPADPAALEKLLAAITCERDRVIIQLFLSSGLRVSELCSLNRDSIRVEFEPSLKRTLGVGRVTGKGDKTREFMVDLATLAQVHEYLLHRGDDGIQALFISSRRRRIGTRTIDHIIRRWCRRAGLPDIHLHQLRARFATDLYRLGVPTLEISHLLGHSSAAITEAYIQPDRQRMRQEYFAAYEKTQLQLKGLAREP